MTVDNSKMCFGLSTEMDRKSFAAFLRLMGRKEFVQSFSRRVSSDEIIAFTDSCMILLRKYLGENEYHRFFLSDTNHNHHEEE